ncbi:MAG: ornithine carbamoyltransferase [Candidatus Anammoxibacter sp.]
MNCKKLTSVIDLSINEIEEIFDLTTELKTSDVKKYDQSLSGKILGMIFEKSSMRTRVSFEVAMILLGGHAIYLTKQDINLGGRESIKDGAHVLSRYVNCIAIRTYAHETVEELAREASVPVINALSDYAHPCQALADLYTIKEKLGSLKGVTLSFIGDGNNVARSLAFLCAKLGVKFKIASPKQYELDSDTISLAKEMCVEGSSLSLCGSSEEAVKGTDVIYTDTWISMGQESEAEIRRKDFEKYQVNSKLVSLGKKDVIIMHCLPAHRGEEITDEVIDGPNSAVYDQAENRMHIEKALLKLLLS